MNIKRRFLAVQVAAAIALASCTGGGTPTTTVAQILATIQNSCGFVTTAEAIIPVILSLLSTFNAAAGAGATVAVSVAQQVADAVCVEVKEKTIVPSTSPAAGLNTTVVVNGVPVVGHIAGPKTMKLKE